MSNHGKNKKNITKNKKKNVFKTNIFLKESVFIYMNIILICFLVLKNLKTLILKQQ